MAARIRWNLALPMVALLMISGVAVLTTMATPPHCGHNDPDPDGDGLCNSEDNCDNVANVGQDNLDHDAFGDACDTCTDTDGDGFGNPSFPVNTCLLDNCPYISNPTQLDDDHDAIGDACDPCIDQDNDGFGLPGPPTPTCPVDNCPTVSNPTQANFDADAFGDACDTCTDTDGDGRGNPGFTANTCALDNCPLVANPGQQNSDSDAFGNACDNCPANTNQSQADADADGQGDACDAWTICAPDELAPGTPQRVVRLPNPDYLGGPPAVGATFTDVSLGCSFKRLTNGYEDNMRQVSHDYSTMSPFNSNSTRILVERGVAGATVIDLNGNIIRTNFGVTIDAQPRWSISDANLFYYHTLEHPPTPGNQVYIYDVGTGTSALLHTFSAYTSILFGGGKGDISDDGNYLLVQGVKPDANGTCVDPNDANKKWFVEGFLFNVFDQTTSTPVRLDCNGECLITPVTDNMLCGGASGLELYKGFQGTYAGQTYASGEHIWNVFPVIGHSDVGRDIDGEEVIVRIGYNDGSPGGCDPDPGIEKINIRTRARTCLRALPYDVGGGPGGMHISINNVSGHPWILVSNYTHRFRGDGVIDLPVNAACNYPSCSLAGCRVEGDPNADWRCVWGPYHNEIFLLKLDGSQLHRLAHHYARQDPDETPNNLADNCPCQNGCPASPVCSCGGGGTDLVDSYWSTPRASISRDGRYVLFDSNFGEQPCLRYHDVYLMETLRAPSCGLCQVEYCTGADIGCRANGQCGPGGCCYYDCGLPMPGCTDAQCPPNVCGFCGGGN